MRIRMFQTLILTSILFLGSHIHANVEVIPSFLPILTNRAANMVLQFSITGPSVLEEIAISTQGTSNINDIQAISVYYLGTKYTRLLPPDNPQADEKNAIFAHSSDIERLVVLKGDMPLAKGKHYFALSYTLSPQTDLMNRFTVDCKYIVADGKKTEFSPPYNKKFIPAVRIRHKGDDGSLGYRIPGLQTTPRGTLLASYDIRRGGQRDLQGDMDTGLSRSTDGGGTWEPMRVIIDMGQWGGLPEKFNGVSDPGMVVDKKTGNIFCASLWMHGIRDENCQFVEGLTIESDLWQHQWFHPGSCDGLDEKKTCQFMMVHSSDDGRTWSQPQNLTALLKNPKWKLLSPGHGITLSDGTLAMAAQGLDENSKGFSTIIYSRDNGSSWQIGKGIRHNIGECGIVELSDGRIMLNGRSPKGTGFRGVATTSDMGATWQDHPTDLNALIEPSCMGSLIKYDGTADGKTVLLFSCPNSNLKREKMTIKASLDEGMTWPEDKQLMLDQFGGSYSCLTTVKEGVIGIVYESSQGYLIFQKIAIDEILNNLEK